MVIRCNNPECRCVIDFDKGHRSLHGRQFCSSTCADVYASQVLRFAVVTDPYSPFPLNYKPRKRD